jgi:heme oxygenase
MPVATPPTRAPLRQRLRLETDDIHQMLHLDSSMNRMMSGEGSKANYLQVLQNFFQFYSRTEIYFECIPSELHFPREAKPLELLYKDFAVLGEPVPTLDKAYDVVADKYAIEQTLESYLGYLYVKQGSTLGGQVISKQLKKLGLEPGESQFFFNGSGSNTGDNWKEFLAFLAQLEPTINADSVVSSARTHFLILHHFFKQSFASGGENGPG